MKTPYAAIAYDENDVIVAFIDRVTRKEADSILAEWHHTPPADLGPSFNNAVYTVQKFDGTRWSIVREVTASVVLVGN